MRNMSAKKITLCLIALLGTLTLLIGLFFNIFALDVGLGDQISSSVNNLLGTKSNGFNMLKLKFSNTLTALFSDYIVTTYLEPLAIACGVVSIFILVVVGVNIVLSLINLLKPTNPQKSTRNCIVITAINCVSSLLYCIVGIVATSMLNQALEITEQTEISFTTSAWISLLLQVLLLVATIICNKMIASTDLKAKTSKNSSVGNWSGKDYVNALICEEKAVIVAIRKYKGLLDDTIITFAEFTAKKAALLNHANIAIKSRLVSLRNLVGCAILENDVVELIREYQLLLNEEILTSIEFAEKKSSLLQYVIK